MQKSTLRIVGNKAVLNIRERMCETAEELLASDKFRQCLIIVLIIWKSGIHPPRIFENVQR
jgi:hypothetical protein